MHSQRNIVTAWMAQCFSLVLLLVMTGCDGSTKSISPVSVSISPDTAMLDATGAQQFTATVKNASDTRVRWKITDCSGAACGTISPAGLYTAPSVAPGRGLTLSITATSVADSAKSASARVSLLPLTIAIPEDSVALGAGETHQFTANVTRNPNTAVTWSVPWCTGTACGAITDSGLYTSPPLIPDKAIVSVTATSQADPSKFDTVTVRQMPVAVSIGPSWRSVPPGATLDFTAAVQYDRENAGVTWSLGGCSAANCGALTKVTRTSVTYTAPAAARDPSTVMLSAKSVKDTSKAAEANITISTTTLLKEGDYAFYLSGVRTAVAGRFHADGRGNITNGIEDLNIESGIFESVAFTGTYAVGQDCRGSFTITTADGTSTFNMTVDSSGTKGQFIKFDALPANSATSGTGYFEMQDKAAFSLPALAGSYAIGISSEDRPFAAVGRLTAAKSGEFTDGRMDVTEHIVNGGYFRPDNTSRNLTLTGSITAPSSSTGRGTATMNLAPAPHGGTANLNFAYYIISDQKIVLVQTDTRTSNSTVLSGEMRRQDASFSVASFNAPSIFSSSGFGLWGFGLAAAAGRIVPDGSGAITGMIDQNNVGDSWDFPGITSNEFHGSYSVDPDGRSMITLQAGLVQWTYTGYFFGQNQGFLLQTSVFFPALGRFKPQDGGPFTAASISETFLTNTMAGQVSIGENDSGLTSFDGSGAVTSTLDIANLDITNSSDLSHVDFSGTYTVAASGRGTIAFDSPKARTVVFWIISPTELVGISTVDLEDYIPALVDYRK